MSSFHLLKTLIQSYGYRHDKPNQFNDRKGNEILFVDDKMIINKGFTCSKVIDKDLNVEFYLTDDKEDTVIYKTQTKQQFYLTIIEVISELGKENQV